ncbi:MAG: hypothetical protein GWN29_13500 [Gammaproteobacteria bacterium]|nr:hypothetical protein [Gammaproteobacteria bacterium]
MFIRSLVFAAAALSPLSPTTVAAQETADGRARWQAAAIDDYEYSYQRVCDCHPDQLADTIVTVTNGAVTAVRYAREDYAQDVPVAEDRLSWFRTIEDLFALVENAAANGAQVSVTFDAEHGYPTRVYVDYVRDLVGDEVDLTITGFRALDAAGSESQ